MIYSSSQEKAFELIKKWLEERNKQIFVLAGVSGSGKSTVIANLKDEVGLQGKVVYATLTGRAAVNLNSRGVKCVTIHSLIYDRDLNKAKLAFKKKESIDPDIGLIIIDEYSLVDKQVHRDLLSYGIPILVVGDPWQHPPVGEYLGLLDNPDYYMSEILRQASDSPIIQLSQKIINKQTLKVGNYGDVIIAPVEKIPEKVYHSVNQIVVFTNDRRKSVNQLMRKELGLRDIYPMKGDKIILCSTNWDISVDGVPMVNGTLGHVSMCRPILNNTFLNIMFQPEFSEDTVCLMSEAGTYKGLSRHHDEAFHTEFGYAITSHKAQGSEWEKVLVLADSIPFKGIDRIRALYTSCTRAKKKLILGV